MTVKYAEVRGRGNQKTEFDKLGWCRRPRRRQKSSASVSQAEIAAIIGVGNRRDS